MADGGPKIIVTASSVCKSQRLRGLVSEAFPGAIFSDPDHCMSESGFVDFCREADGILIGREIIGESALQALPRVKIISVYGVGLDNVDQQALKKRRVALGWSPGLNKRSVAELTLCFLLGLCHNIFKHGFALKNNRWLKEGGFQLTGKTVGIVGCGNTGGELARLLAPFQCRLLIHDILDKSGFCAEIGARQVGWREVVEQSDFITLHVPLTESTLKMVDSEVLQAMKRTAFLLNVARGRVVDQEALKVALKDHWIAGAAIDVFEREPPDDAEFLALPNLMTTPHIAGNTREAVEAMGKSAISHLVHFFSKHRRIEIPIGKGEDSGR